LLRTTQANPDRRPPQGGVMKSIWTLGAGAVVAVSLGLAGAAAAQTGKLAGVVTTLQGTANVQPASATPNTPPTQPRLLKFKDDVFEQDRITTGDKSLTRILLGGKAVVTIRELSSLTITTTNSTATVDIASGKVALAVAKEKMKPGERIDVRTPNAVA